MEQLLKDIQAEIDFINRSAWRGNVLSQSNSRLLSVLERSKMLVMAEIERNQQHNA